MTPATGASRRRARAMHERIGASLSLFVVFGSLVLVGRAFSAVDGRATLQAIRSVGPWVCLSLLPFALALTLDALGTRVLLRAVGGSVSLGRLLLLRIATEALHVTMPAGFVVADSATVASLNASSKIPLSQGAAVMLGRKWLVTRAHAPYIALGTGVGWAVLPWLAGVSAAVPLALSLATGAGFSDTSALARVQAAFAGVRFCRVAEAIARRRASAVALGENMTRIGASRSAT